MSNNYLPSNMISIIQSVLNRFQNKSSLPHSIKCYSNLMRFLESIDDVISTPLTTGSVVLERMNFGYFSKNSSIFVIEHWTRR